MMSRLRATPRAPAGTRARLTRGLLRVIRAPILRSRAVRWALELALVVGVYFAVSLYQTRHAIGVDAAFPDVPLRDVRGEPVDLVGTLRQPTMVHVWATWCAVCRQEFGAIEALAAAPPSDAAVVTIVADGEDAARVRGVMEEHGIGYPVLLADAEAMSRVGVSAFPTTYYLRRDGTVSSVTVGMSLRWAMWLRLWWAAQG